MLLTPGSSQTGRQVWVGGIGTTTLPDFAFVMPIPLERQMQDQQLRRAVGRFRSIGPGEAVIALINLHIGAPTMQHLGRQGATNRIARIAVVPTNRRWLDTIKALNTASGPLEYYVQYQRIIFYYYTYIEKFLYLPFATNQVLKRDQFNFILKSNAPPLRNRNEVCTRLNPAYDVLSQIYIVCRFVTAYDFIV